MNKQGTSSYEHEMSEEDPLRTIHIPPSPVPYSLQSHCHNEHFIIVIVFLLCFFSSDNGLHTQCKAYNVPIVIIIIHSFPSFLPLLITSPPLPLPPSTHFHLGKKSLFSLKKDADINILTHPRIQQPTPGVVPYYKSSRNTISQQKNNKVIVCLTSGGTP